jgi:anthranilate synthase component 1
MAGVPLAGGLVGYSSYDVVRYFERLPSKARAASPVPDLHYVAPESMLVFDHLTRGIALLHAGSEAQRQALRREVIGALRGGLPNYSRGAPPAGERYSAAVGSLSRDEYMVGVKRTQEYIAAGDVYQLVLSSRFAGRHSLDPFEAYRALRLINPSPYMYYCKLGDVTVVGSSPEALVKVNAAGRAELRPIAGTRPRAEDPVDDARHERELLADVKENAEHVMLVDLARNDLGRVARAGSVHVEPYRVIERYSHVMHMVSGVKGALAPGRDAFDLFAATFPAGTLVGAPKVRAMEIIDEACTAAPWGTSVRTATWTRPSPFARWYSVATSTATRPAPASSPTACPRRSTTKSSPSPAPWRARSSSRPRDYEQACERANERTTAVDRQLRFLHLQPGAGLPGAGRGSRRAPQRRHHRRAGSGRGSHASVHLAGAGHSL